MIICKIVFKIIYFFGNGGNYLLGAIVSTYLVQYLESLLRSIFVFSEYSRVVVFDLPSDLGFYDPGS